MSATNHFECLSFEQPKFALVRIQACQARNKLILSTGRYRPTDSPSFE